MPLVLLALVVVHILALHEVGSNNPDGIEIKKHKDPRRHPARRHPVPSLLHGEGHRRRGRVPRRLRGHRVLRAGNGGGYFLEANNFVPANPLQTPGGDRAGVVLHAVLRDPARGAAVVSTPGFPAWSSMGASVLIFFFLPWLDRSPVKSIRYRGGLYKTCARRIRGLVPRPGLPRHRADQRLGPVRPMARSTRERATVVARILHACLFPVLPADAVVHVAIDKTRPCRTGNEREDADHERRRLLLCALAACRRPRARRGGGRLRLDRAPHRSCATSEPAGGARTFANYCLSCHSAKYMRYNRLKDLGLTRQQIRDNLMFASDKIGETMKVAMTPAKGKDWFGGRAARPVGRSPAHAARTGSTPICAASTATRRPPAAGTTRCSRMSPCPTSCGRCRASARSTIVRSDEEGHEIGASDTNASTLTPGLQSQVQYAEHTRCATW